LIKSLPPQTGATTLAVLKTIFREAIDNAYCEHSPAATVRRPKIQVVPRKFIPLPDLIALELPKYKTQIVFLAMHGLRWGEAVALTESDIYNGRVHISKSIHGQVKSRAGVRSVPLVSEFKPFPKTPKALRRELAEYGAHIHSLRHICLPLKDLRSACTVRRPSCCRADAPSPNLPSSLPCRCFLHTL